MKLYNHISPRLSDLEWEMAKHIPPGGNWQNIPVHIPSKDWSKSDFQEVEQRITVD